MKQIPGEMSYLLVTDHLPHVNGSPVRARPLLYSLRHPQCLKECLALSVGIGLVDKKGRRGSGAQLDRPPFPSSLGSWLWWVEAFSLPKPFLLYVLL